MQFFTVRQEWKAFARLAYPATLMDCCESFCWGFLTILAGLLPSGAAAVAAASVAMVGAAV